MALDVVSEYLDRARALLQDQVQPYRYPDSELVEALNLAMLEARRLRPDLLKPYFNTTPPEFSPLALDQVVPIDPQYRVAVLYYIIGMAELRDSEDNQDSRASAFLNKFTAQLLNIQA